MFHETRISGAKEKNRVMAVSVMAVNVFGRGPWEGLY
jgi:hypothetical protein